MIANIVVLHLVMIPTIVQNHIAVIDQCLGLASQTEAVAAASEIIKLHVFNWIPS